MSIHIFTFCSAATQVGRYACKHALDPQQISSGCRAAPADMQCRPLRGAGPYFRSKNTNKPRYRVVLRVHSYLNLSIWVVFSFYIKYTLEWITPKTVEILTPHIFTSKICLGHAAQVLRETFKIPVKHVVRTRIGGDIWTYSCFCQRRITATINPSPYFIFEAEE